MEYLCHKWQGIYSTCKHFPVLPLFITYHWICNQIDTTDATFGAGTAHPFGSPAFTLGFSVIRVTRSLFDVHVLLMFVCPFVLFLLGIVISVLRRYTNYDFPVGIFQLFLPIIYVQSFNEFILNSKKAQQFVKLVFNCWY
jgi:hypothetical protein